MDIHEIAELGLKAIPSLIEDLQSMTSGGEKGKEFSPKQRVDAGKALTSVISMVLDRTHPKLTSSQQTNVTVDMAKLLARALPPGEAQRLRDLLLPPKVVEIESKVADAR